MSSVPIMTAGTIVVERGPFEMVPHWLLEQVEVSAHALRLWLVLRKHGDETRTSFPGRKRLGEKLGVSKSTVSRAKDELSAVGAMCYRQRPSHDGDWASNEYHLHWVPVHNCTYFTDGLGSPQVDHGSPLVDGGSPQAAYGSPQVSNEIRLKERDLPKETNLTNTDDASFDAFWNSYPRKQGKGAARKAWIKALTKSDPDTITAAALSYRNDPNREDAFTAHASTWLNDERWDDEPLPARSTDQSKSEQRLRRNVAAMSNWQPIERQLEPWEIAYVESQRKELEA